MHLYKIQCQNLFYFYLFFFHINCDLEEYNNSKIPQIFYINIVTSIHTYHDKNKCGVLIVDFTNTQMQRAWELEYILSVQSVAYDAYPHVADETQS